MPSTVADSWHLVVEFSDLDLDDDHVVDVLIADPSLRIMWSSADGATTADADIEATSFDEAFDVVLNTVARAAPEARVVRVVDPLVTISDIAEAAGVTRQAVRNWALGNRLAGFPRPLDVVGDGVRIWRLAVIDAWLGTALGLGTGRHFPTPTAIALLNEHLNGERDDEGWTEAFVIAEVQSDWIESDRSVPSPSEVDSARLRQR